jgi:hypothetical protein
MMTLDEIEAKLAATASSYFGMPLPADAVEMRQRIRAEHDARANDESLPSEERLQAAFLPFDRASRPWRYLQLFVAGWPPFRDPVVAARVLVEQWNDFDAIPHALFVDLVFPHLSPEALTGAMNAKARMFFDELSDPFNAWRGQDEEAPLGLSWATDPATAKFFARGHGMENPRLVVYQACIAKADIAFVCADPSEEANLERGVVLRGPSAQWNTATPLGFGPSLGRRKRGRPSKAELERDAAYADYKTRLTTSWLQPRDWPLAQQESSGRVPIGRPYDVDTSAPFEKQFEEKPVERFVKSAALLLRLAKDGYRKQSGEKYVRSDVTNDLLEKILPEVRAELRRIGSSFDEQSRAKFFGALDNLDKRLRDKAERLSLKQTILDREKNLGQAFRDRKREIDRAKAREKKRKVHK